MTNPAGGIPIDGIHVQWSGILPPVQVRSAEEIRSVLARADCEICGPVYYMFRDIASSDEDRRWLRENHLRFDITVIPPRKLCNEFVKTKGHYHPENPSGCGYPEIYEVIRGKAHFLLQTRSLSDVIMISAAAGDAVIVPPGYGHVTINPSPDIDLQMANIVSSQFEGVYREYEVRRGAAYYEMTDGSWVRNSLYPSLPALRFLAAECPSGVLSRLTAPIYRMIEDRYEILEFLNSPERFDSLFRLYRADFHGR